MSHAQVAKAFDLEPLYKKNILGDGQTVAVVMDGQVSRSDLDQFDREMEIAGPIDFTPITVDKLQDVDTNKDTAPEATTEATVDIETVHMIAPADKILITRRPSPAWDRPTPSRES